MRKKRFITRFTPVNGRHYFIGDQIGMHSAWQESAVMSAKWALSIWMSTVPSWRLSPPRFPMLSFVPLNAFHKIWRLASRTLAVVAVCHWSAAPPLRLIGSSIMIATVLPVMALTVGAMKGIEAPDWRAWKTGICAGSWRISAPVFAVIIQWTPRESRAVLAKLTDKALLILWPGSAAGTTTCRKHDRG